MMDRKNLSIKPQNGKSTIAPGITAGESVIEGNSQLLSSGNVINLEERERIEKIWTERAAQMAIVDSGADDQDEQLTVVLVRLGRELLGLEVQYIFDIRPRETITRVPRVPGWVVGVTNLRGNILSVVDLRKYFGLPGDAARDESGNRGLLVIVQTQASDYHPARDTRSQNGSMEIVFLVDDVLSVETVSARQTAADSGLIHSLRPEYIRSIAERQIITMDDDSADDILSQRHVVILDTEALLADSHLVIHEEIG